VNALFALSFTLWLVSWWPASGQDATLIGDFDPRVEGSVTLSNLTLMTQEGSCMLDAHAGSASDGVRNFRSTIIIITSVLPLHAWFPLEPRSAQLQLFNRVTHAFCVGLSPDESCVEFHQEVRAIGGQPFQFKRTGHKFDMPLPPSPVELELSRQYQAMKVPSAALASFQASESASTTASESASASGSASGSGSGSASGSNSASAFSVSAASAAVPSLGRFTSGDVTVPVSSSSSAESPATASSVDLGAAQPLLLKRKLSRSTEHDDSPERKKPRTVQRPDVDMKLEKEEQGSQQSSSSSEVRLSVCLSVCNDDALPCRACNALCLLLVRDHARLRMRKSLSR